jgi:hypothetical protein
MPVAIIENWINTPEGSLANQTPVQSAEKLVVKYLEERGKRIKKYSGLDEFMREVAEVPSNVAVEGFFNNLGVAKKLTEYITNVISNTVNTSEVVESKTVPQIFRNQSINLDVTDESVIIDSINIVDTAELDALQASIAEATENITSEELGILEVEELPISENRQELIDQLDMFDPFISHPEITEFWDSNIEDGSFSTEVKNFKRENNINSLEDLLDLYDRNPNSMWSSPQDLIDQIKKCNL